MSVSDQGYTVVDLSPISPAILDSFHGCSPVNHAGQVTWYQRALQFHITWTADDTWFYELVGAGAERRDSVVRFRDIDFTPLLRAALDHVWLDLSVDWLIELSQVRTVVPARRSGHALPRRHRIGAAEVVLIVVARNHGLAGSEIRLGPPDEPEPCWQAAVAPGQALVITRPDLIFDLDAGHGCDDGGGIQDTLVITMSRSAARGASLLRHRAAS